MGQSLQFAAGGGNVQDFPPPLDHLNEQSAAEVQLAVGEVRRQTSVGGRITDPNEQQPHVVYAGSAQIQLGPCFATGRDDQIETTFEGNRGGGGCHEISLRQGRRQPVSQCGIENVDQDRRHGNRTHREIPE